jgi:hypothetical protein
LSIGPFLLSVSAAALLPWVMAWPSQTATITVLGYLIGFILFASAKIATIRQDRLFSWGSASMTLAYRRRYRIGYALMGFALLLTICLSLTASMHRVY